MNNQDLSKYKHHPFMLAEASLLWALIELFDGIYPEPVIHLIVPGDYYPVYRLDKGEEIDTFQYVANQIKRVNAYGAYLISVKTPLDPLVGKSTLEALVVTQEGQSCKLWIGFSRSKDGKIKYDQLETTDGCNPGHFKLLLDEWKRN